MGIVSKISWTHATYNHWIGCSKVSPGCVFCYAEDLDKRRFGGGHWGVGANRKLTSEKNRRLPFAWDAQVEKTGVEKRVFCSSLSDWLDPEVPVEWLIGLLDIIAQTPHLTWLMLTKRPELWRSRMRAVIEHGGFSHGRTLADKWDMGRAPENVWFGVTVEDQKRADERIPILLTEIPARIRFLSCEPLLSEVTVQKWALRHVSQLSGHRYKSRWDAMTGGQDPRVLTEHPGIDWIIVGGESGANARPFYHDWARQLVEECKEYGIACWVKQMGDNAFDHNGVAIKYDGHHGANPAEWPEDLRVQLLPQEATE